MNESGHKPGQQDSPFHAGEQAMQSRFGVRDKLESFGRQLIRGAMPEQHRELFGKLPYFMLGSTDGDGRVWASALFGEPRFVRAPDASRLCIDACLSADDPLHGALLPGAAVAGLGIELHTLRRNRVNGKVAAGSSSASLAIEVIESYGNCPQYIQKRQMEFQTPAGPAGDGKAALVAGALDAAATTLVRRADTLFIASAFGGGEGRDA